MFLVVFFFFKQKTAYEIMPSLVGSEMCIRDRFLFVLCTIAIAGCNDTESSESRLEIKAVNTNFQATGGKGYIQLQATGNITADVNADWCVLKEVNPNEVVFEVKENTGYSGRNALLTISNGCLLYTSDAADDLHCVDLGGRRFIKKKKNEVF